MAQSKRTSASYMAESRNTKPLSKAMYNWAKANMSKLKQPTKAQKKIFEKYKAMKAAGDTPANPKPRPKPAPATPSSKPAPATPSSKPAKKAAPKSKTGAAVLKMGGSNVKKITPPSDKPKKTATRHRGGARAAVNRRPARDLKIQARETSNRARQMNPNPISMPMSPPKNPKEGDVYKKPFGPVMIYKNGKFIRK